MISPSRFTLDSVREFMVANDGRVKNHDLVRHFRFFLTDPAQKDIARVQFKEFVNTLATIKVEDGEKILILKRQFRADNGDNLSQSSSSSHSTPTTASVSLPDQPPVLRTPPPYRPPPQPRAVLCPQQRRSPPPPPPPQQFHAPRAMPHQAPLSASVTAQRSREQPRFINGAGGGVRMGAPFAGAVGVLPMVPAHMSLPPVSGEYTGAPGDSVQRHSWVAPSSRELHPPGLPPFPEPGGQQPPPRHPPGTLDCLPIPNPPAAANNTHTRPAVPANLAALNQVQHAPAQSGCQPSHQLLTHSSRADQQQQHPVPPIRRHKSLDERRLSYSEQRDSGDAFDEADSDGGSSQKVISVREHTKLFNRIASETQLQLPDKRQQYRHSALGKNQQSEDDDSASTTTTDGFSKEWCMASASSNYIELIRLLKNNPKLAKQKDFVTGYTALHWAAKHGNLDTIKLLAGTHAVDVHCRTRGGYTALHIAVQFGHEDAANLLIHTYGADANMRDYSGKKARQYQQREQTVISTKAVHKINKRKLIVDRDNGFLRIGSLNVRVKRTTTALNSFISGPSSEDSASMPPPQSTGVTSSRSSHSSSTASLLNAAAANARRSVRKRKSRRERDKFDALKSRISAPILLDQPEIAGGHSSGVAQSLSLTELCRQPAAHIRPSSDDVTLCGSAALCIDTGASSLSLPSQLHSTGAVGVASSGQTTPTHNHHGSAGAVGVASSCQTTPTYSRHSFTSAAQYRLSSGGSVYDTDCGVDEADHNSDAEYGFDRNWS